MILLKISPAVWALIAMIVVPALVFTILTLQVNGFFTDFFNKFKRKK